MEQAEQFGRNAVEVISSAELAAKLADGRPLRIKLGMDPTAPDLHLGHSIALKKLRDFQRAGHTVIFLVGVAPKALTQLISYGVAPITQKLGGG